MKEQVFSRVPPVLMALLIITVAGGLLRYAYVQQTLIDTPIRADARSYVIYAHNLSTHGVYSNQFEEGVVPEPDSFRPPGYPLLILLALKLGGNDGYYSLLLSIQVLLGLLLIPLSYRLARVLLPPGGSLAVAGLVALSPHLVSACSYVLTECLFGVVLTSALLLTGVALVRKGWPWALLAGATYGFAYLVNPTILPVPFLLAALFLAPALMKLLPPSCPGLAGFLRSAATRQWMVLLIPVVLIWGGWTARSLSLPPEKRGGSRALMTICHGTYPGLFYKTERYRNFAYHEDPLYPRMSESWEGFFEVFGPRFGARPIRHLSWFLLEKPYYIWSWNILQGGGDVYIYPVVSSLYQKNGLARATHHLMKRMHVPLLVLATLAVALGLWRLIRSRLREPPGLRWIILGVPLYYTLLLILFNPLPRYTIPLRAAFYTCALLGLMEIWKIIRDSREPRGSTG